MGYLRSATNSVYPGIRNTRSAQPDRRRASRHRHRIGGNEGLIGITPAFQACPEGARVVLSRRPRDSDFFNSPPRMSRALRNWYPIGTRALIRVRLRRNL